MTEQEINGYLYWLQENYNRPDRHDYYLMKIAQEVRRVLSSKPNEITLDEFQIKFSTEPKKEVAELTPEQIAIKKKEISDMYRAALGIKVPPQKPVPPKDATTLKSSTKKKS